MSLERGERMNLHASLSVDARHDKVWITFKVENRGERRVWLPRALTDDPRPAGRVFDVRVHPGGAPVAHMGVAARTVPGTADWFELPPHSAHTHTVDITADYAFLPGDHTYELRYEGVALADIHQPDATTAFSTDAVMFRHVAP
jgi:hypothetical protein